VVLVGETPAVVPSEKAATIEVAGMEASNKATHETTYLIGKRYEAEKNIGPSNMQGG